MKKLIILLILLQTTQLMASTNTGEAIGEAPWPFAGCATCHMVDQGLDIEGVGMRGYNDAAKRTPIFFRLKDGMRTTLRNIPALIGLGSSLVQSPFVHYDRDITSIRHTILGNFTGRNMGWLPEEKGHYIGSPYDKFLKKNGLPTGPEKNESLYAYLGRLVRGIYYLKDPKFVEVTKLETHGGKVVQFKEREFQGLKKFLKLRPF